MSIKQLGDAHTALVVLSEKNYLKNVLELVRQAAHDKVCYVTLNKTCNALIELFKKQKIAVKNIKIIDGITHAIQDVENTEDCTYISSPEAITELSIVINTHLKYQFDYLIFDSLNNLLTYTNPETVKKFFKGLVAKLDGKPYKIVIFALDVPDQQGLIKIIGTYVDKVILQ